MGACNSSAAKDAIVAATDLLKVMNSISSQHIPKPADAQPFVDPADSLSFTVIDPEVIRRQLDGAV